MKTNTLLLFLALFLVAPLTAQDDASTIFYRITKLHDKGDLMSVEYQLMRPFFQERINQGTQLWHGLYRIVSPRGEHADADYVSVDAYGSLAHAMLADEEESKVVQAAFPDAEINAFWQKVGKHSEVQSEVVYEVLTAVPLDEYAIGEDRPKVVAVNYMQVSPDSEGDYVELETEVFGPIMQEHKKRGNMEGWVVCSRVLPGGTDFGSNNITADIYLSLEQLMKYRAAFYDVAMETHSGMDMDKLSERINDAREMKRTELWELQTETTPPAQEDYTYEVTKEGQGPKAMRGQEVTWRGKVLSADGKVLQSTDNLGMHAQDIVGSDPYDPMLNEAMTRVGKGGTVKVTIPPSRMSYGQQANNKGQPVYWEFEVIDVGAPAKDGTAKLRDILMDKDLKTAREWYASVQKSNPHNYVFREFRMNALGYELMGEGMPDAAIYVLDTNRQNYPDSFNVYDSLADAYSNAGDDYHAKKHYEKALEKNPDSTVSAEKLAELK